MRMLFPLLVIAICIALQGVQALSPFARSSGSSLLLLRGGKKPAPKPVALKKKESSSSRSRIHSEANKKKKKRRPADDEDEEDDNDDEEEEEEDESERRRSESRGKAKKTSARSHRQLVPWGSKVFSPKKSLFSLREGLGKIAKTGSSAYKSIYRRAKVLKSSAFEGILLKATWPSNDPVPAPLLTEIVKYSIPAFKYSRSDTEDDPYYMTMHKLWTKMSEKDWRVVTKSLFILHCISRDSSVEACNKFADAIKDLSKNRNPKQPDSKYFDLRVVCDLDAASEPFESFVEAYAEYTIFRAKTFSQKFDELKSLSPKTPPKKALAVLNKAKSLISLGLKVQVEKNERNVITGQAVKLVAIDLREIWKLYSSALHSFAQSNSTKGKEKEILALLQNHKDLGEEIKQFLSASAKAFSKIQVKIPTDLNAPVSAEKLQAQMDKLSQLSGGFSRREEEDDEEYDDEEGEREEEEEDDEEEENEEDEEEEDTENEEDVQKDTEIENDVKETEESEQTSDESKANNVLNAETNEGSAETASSSAAQVDAEGSSATKEDEQTRLEQEECSRSDEDESEEEEGREDKDDDDSCDDDEEEENEEENEEEEEEDGEEEDNEEEEDEEEEEEEEEEEDEEEDEDEDEDEDEE